MTAPRLWSGIFLLAAALAAVVLAPSASATTRRVPEEYATIQEAIDQSSPGDTVLLSPGTFRGVGNRDIEFRGRDIVLTSVAGAEETIIDCEGLGQGFYMNGYETRAAVIEDVTIQNGVASATFRLSGGGICCAPSSPTIRRCRILWNRANAVGGGVVLRGFDGILEECVISGNQADLGGGGVSFTFGSGEIRNCVITGNWGLHGGGIYFDGPANLNGVVGCTIAANLGTHGGGVNSPPGLELERCIVWGNCTFWDGEQVYCTSGTLRCCSVDSLGVTDGTVFDEHCVFDDPLFCASYLCGWHTYGDWSLNSGSPCLPENSPCGEMIGALGLGCGASVGACCFPDGDCVVLTPQLCQAQLGSYLGDGTDCDANPCPQPPQPEACCAADGACTLLLEADCVGQGGTYQGGPCDPNPCHSTPAQIPTWGGVKALFRGGSK